MTVNNDKEYFREHPQYHMYLHPEMRPMSNRWRRATGCWTEIPI